MRGLAIAIVVSLAACGGGQPPAQALPDFPAPEPKHAPVAEPTPTPPGPTPTDDPPPPEPVAVDDDEVHGGLLGNEGIGDGTGPTPPPTTSDLEIGDPRTTGNQLDKAIIRRYVQRNREKLAYCYDKALLASPRLRGTVTVELTIGANGTVESSKATGVAPVVSDCFATVIRAIEFPKPKGGGSVEVVYPFTMKPRP